MQFFKNSMLEIFKTKIWWEHIFLIYQVKWVLVKFPALGYFDWDLRDWIDIESDLEKSELIPSLSTKIKLMYLYLF